MLRFGVYVLSTAAIVAAIVMSMRLEVEPGPAARDVELEGVDEWVCPPGTPGSVSCAYVSVPEDYSDPEIRQVRLYTARISPPLGGDEPPIAFIGNGLGRVSVSQFGDWQRAARTLGRDVVLIDLRGSGRSEPRLSCPEVRDDGWLEADLNGDALDLALEQVGAALTTCRDRLAAEIPLSAYSLDAMAHDLDLVRERLGIDKWVLAGGGDASMVARRTGELHGDGARLARAARSGRIQRRSTSRSIRVRQRGARGGSRT